MDKTPFTALDQINNAIPGLSPQQCKLAEFITRNYKKAAFLTSTALGDASGVSESTVVRLAIALGYSGFPQLQAALQELIQRELTSIERFSFPNKANRKFLYAKVLSAEAEHMVKVIDSIAPKLFDKAVDLLCRQKRVFVVGFQASACLASFAAYSLAKVRPDICRINHWDESICLRVAESSRSDVALVYIFPRYPRFAVRLLQMFRTRHTPVVLVTNSSLSPFAADLAGVVLPISIRYDSFLDSFAPVFSFTNALIMATALKDNDRTTEHLEQFETFVKESQIFESGVRPGE
jgi:DNA-binding MurR/RpiR family transcriptional regulator